MARSPTVPSSKAKNVLAEFRACGFSTQADPWRSRYFEAETSQDRRHRACPAQARSKTAVSGVHFSALRSLRTAVATTAKGHAHLRAPERSLQAANYRASRIRTALRTGSTNSDLSSYTRRSAV